MSKIRKTITLLKLPYTILKIIFSRPPYIQSCETVFVLVSLVVNRVARSNQEKLMNICRLLVVALDHPELVPALWKAGVKSESQLLQDVVMLACLNMKQNGVFIEVGVGDGIKHSNSYMLEKEFGWSGLLIEPNTQYSGAIRQNRTLSKLLNVAATSDDGIELIFEADLLNHEHSRISLPSPKTSASSVSVRGYTLNTLIAENLTDREIDFISIDVEGAELDVIKGFDLEKHKPKFICVEHNYDTSKIYQLKNIFESYGYVCIYEYLSEFDLWFVKKKNNGFYDNYTNI